MPADPGAPDVQSKGQILISFGKLFEKVCCIFFEVRLIAEIFQKGLSLAQASAMSNPKTAI